MSFYQGLRTTATRLISEKGRNVTLRTFVKTGTGLNPTLTPTDTTIKAVVIDYKLSQVDGTLVKMGDKEFLLVSDTVITEDMKFVDGSVTYDIVMVKQVAPGDLDIVYKVQARK